MSLSSVRQRTSSPSPAKLTVTARSSGTPGLPPNSARARRDGQIAAGHDSRQRSETLQQLQCKLLATSADLAEHREEVETALARLAGDVGMKGSEREALKHATGRLEDLETKVTRASELSCDVYDQQVAYQTQCDSRFSAMRQAIGEQRTITDETRRELKSVRGSASKELCRALVALRPELPQLCRGRAPEEAPNCDGLLGSGEWLETSVKHADLMAFSYGLLRRLRELMEVNPADEADDVGSPELSPVRSVQALDEGTAPERGSAVLGPASAEGWAEVPRPLRGAGASSATLAELAQAQKRACEDVKAASKEACAEIQREVQARLRTLRKDCEQSPGSAAQGMLLDARYDEVLTATSRASAEVAATASEASARLAHSVMASQVQLERNLCAEAEQLAKSLENCQKTWFETASAEMVASMAQRALQNDEAACAVEDPAETAVDEAVALDLTSTSNASELSELQTMVGGTRRRICETSRSVAQLNEELHATVVTVQNLQLRHDALAADGREHANGYANFAENLPELRAQIISEVRSGLCEDAAHRSASLGATAREARRDLEVLREEIEKRLDDEHRACDVVHEVLGTARSSLYTELNLSLDQRLEAAEASTCKSFNMHEEELRQLVVEEQLRRTNCINDLRADMASCLSERNGNPSSLSAQREIRTELLEATEAMQAVGLEMCEARDRAKHTAHRQASAQAASVELIACELADSRRSQNALAVAMRGALVEADARTCALRDELRGSPMGLVGGVERMDVDTTMQPAMTTPRPEAVPGSGSAASLTPLAEALNGPSRRHVTFAHPHPGEPHDAMMAVPSSAPVQSGVATATRFSELPTSSVFNPNTAMLLTSQGSQHAAVPALQLPTATSPRGTSPRGTAAASPSPLRLTPRLCSSSAPGLRQPSPTLAGQRGAASLRQPSPSTLGGGASARGRHSSPAVPMSFGSPGPTGPGPAAMMPTGVPSVQGRRSETPLCAWNGGMQGAPPRTPREALARP